MEVTVDRVVNLKLNIDEARWLTTIMQNPLHGESLAEEDETNATMRRDLFDALRAVL